MIIPLSHIVFEVTRDSPSKFGSMTFALSHSGYHSAVDIVWPKTEIGAGFCHRLQLVEMHRLNVVFLWSRTDLTVT